MLSAFFLQFLVFFQWIACGNSADASSPCCILLQILPGVMVASCRAICLRASLLPSWNITKRFHRRNKQLVQSSLSGANN
ncbi:hypothetical protein CICLE_v10013901mg [Citrus x clementina]|uniref:Secreted protein n=1 Tax=Citrus clementina TaxID=85681 RepID=V4S5P0_CITCL|nr:hypothetical protein CICLE_v10013901mg [Citrus x clementina]